MCLRIIIRIVAFTIRNLYLTFKQIISKAGINLKIWTIKAGKLMGKEVKFIMSIFLCFFISVVMLSCSASKKNTKENTVTGQIQMVGNMPFAKLAVRNNKELYILDCSGAVKNSAYNNQGKTAKFFFSSISTNNLNEKVIKVEKIEILPAGSK